MWRGDDEKNRHEVYAARNATLLKTILWELSYLYSDFSWFEIFRFRIIALSGLLIVHSRSFLLNSNLKKYFQSHRFEKLFITISLFSCSFYSTRTKNKKKKKTNFITIIKFNNFFLKIILQFEKTPHTPRSYDFHGKQLHLNVFKKKWYAF